MRGSNHSSRLNTNENEHTINRESIGGVHTASNEKTHNSNLNNKEYKLKTEILLGHVLDKGKVLRPEMLDFIDFKMKRRNSPGRYSPEVTNRYTTGDKNFGMFNTKASSRGLNTIVKSRNAANQSMAFNATARSSKHLKSSKFNSPSRFYDTINMNESNVPNKNAP
jgi:hypothetical protein